MQMRPVTGRATLDASVIDHVVTVEVGLQLDRLADAHVLQLDLLKLRRPTHRQFDDRQQWRAGIYALPELHALAGDDAIHRGGDPRPFEREGRFPHLGDSPHHLRVARCLDAARLRQRDLQVLAR